MDTHLWWNIILYLWSFSHAFSLVCTVLRTHNFAYLKISFSDLYKQIIQPHTRSNKQLNNVCFHFWFLCYGSVFPEVCFLLVHTSQLNWYAKCRLEQTTAEIISFHVFFSIFSVVALFHFPCTYLSLFLCSLSPHVVTLQNKHLLPPFTETTSFCYQILPFTKAALCIRAILSQDYHHVQNPYFVVSSCRKP